MEKKKASTTKLRNIYLHIHSLQFITPTLLYLFQQRRGLDDKNLLPYFPYRDDGEQVLQVIQNMVKEYVDL